MGLLPAIRYPDLSPKLIVCGANLTPDRLKRRYRFPMQLQHLFSRNPLLRLMLTQLNISKQELQKIQCTMLVPAGERDLIKDSHTRMIAENIPKSTLKIPAGGGNTCKLCV